MFVRQILMTPKEFSSNREQAQFPAPKTFEWAKQSDAHYTPPSVVSFSYRHHRPLCWPSARSCMGFWGRIHRKFALIFLQIFPQIFAQIFFFQKFAQIFAKIFAQKFLDPNFFANNCAKICTYFFYPKICANICKKIFTIFSHPKIFANNFAKICSNIFNQKNCANKWA